MNSNVKKIFDGCTHLGLSEEQAWQALDAIVSYTQKPDATKFRDLLKSVHFDDTPTNALIDEIIKVWWQNNSPQDMNQLILTKTIDMVNNNLALWKEFVTMAFKDYGGSTKESA